VPHTLRRIQLAGLALVFLSAFGTGYHYRSHPFAGAAPRVAEAVPVGFFSPGTRHVPAERVGAAVAALRGGPREALRFWEIRPWYPYVLAPIWLLCLLGAAGGGRVRRRRLGAALWALSGGLAVFEAFYLHTDYASFLPGTLGRVEVFLAWAIVVALLVFRRRTDRHLGAVEATVGAQALLAFVHLITLPTTMARPWVVLYDFSAVLHSIFQNFPPAFWLGCAGFLVVALPVYVRRAG
jgi:hypothetical protein